MLASVSPRTLAPPPAARRSRGPRPERRPVGQLSAAELRRWLVASGFAVEIDGRLVPTPLGAEVAAALRS
jgi:hypothetical protein